MSIISNMQLCFETPNREKSHAATRSLQKLLFSKNINIKLLEKSGVKKLRTSTIKGECHHK